VRLDDGSLDFSFSGLKSAVVRHVRGRRMSLVAAGGEPSEEVREVAAAFQEAAVETLLGQLRRAVEERAPRSVLLAGGVACNSRLRAGAAALGAELGLPVYLPSPALATDNAAMIAALGGPLLARGDRHGPELDVDPGLATGT
jgi:N6-L-threonylcarbamoyladenine synthase